MKKNELLIKACKKCGMDFNNPEVNDMALDSLDDGIRKYSNKGAFTFSQGVLHVHLDGDTTIGRPVMKDSYNLHVVDYLPDMTGYAEDNDFGFLPYVDFFWTGGNAIHTYAEVDGEWQWLDIGKEYADTYLLRNPDYWVRDMESINEIIVDNHTELLITRSQYLCGMKGMVVEGYDGNVHIVSRECDADIVYNRTINVAELQEICVPNIYLNLLKLYVAWSLSMVAEEKTLLLAELSEVENEIQSSNNISFVDFLKG